MSEFNPDEFLASEPEEEIKPKKIKHLDQQILAGTEELLNTLTLGYGPEILAGVDYAKQAIKDPLSKDFEAKGYEQLVEDRRKEHKTLSKQYPAETTVGTIGGALATVPFMGGSGAAAGLGSRAATAAKVAATMGFLQNPNQSLEDHDYVNLGERTKGAAIGGILGPTLELGLAGGRGIVNAPKNLKDFAEKRAFNALKPIQSAQEAAERMGKVESTGETLLSEGVVKPLKTRSQMLPEVTTKIESYGNQIGDFLEDIGSNIYDPKKIAQLPEKERVKMLNGISKNQINPQKIADELEDWAEKQIFGVPGEESSFNTVSGYIDTLRGHGNSLTIGEAHNLRRNMDHAINWRSNKELTVKGQQALYKIRTALEKGIEGQIESAAPMFPKGIETYRNLKKAYGNLSRAEGILEKSVAADSRNRTFSLTDYIVGGSLASGSGFIGDQSDDANIASNLIKMIGVGVVGAGANSMLRTYGSQAAAYWADRARYYMMKDPVFYRTIAPQFNKLLNVDPAKAQAFLLRSVMDYKPMIPVEEEFNPDEFVGDFNPDEFVGE